MSSLLCTLAFVAPSHAGTKVTVSDKITGIALANSTLNITSNSYPPLEITCATNVSGITWWGATAGEASAFAHVEVGKLRVSAVSDSHAAVLSPGMVAANASQTSAMSYWNDNFTISSSNQPLGQLGEMTVLVLVKGNMDLQCHDPQSTVYFRLSVRVNDSFGADTNFAGGTETMIANDGTVQTLPMDGALVGPGLWPVHCQFHFGRPTFVTAWAEVVADARASATNIIQGTVNGHASSDFSHSVIWAGITDVRGAGGAAVTNFTMTSDSGYNYGIGTISDALAITRIEALPQGLTLEWTDLGPRSYTVETTASLSLPNWGPTPNVSWPIHTNAILLPLPAESPAFFRVRAQ
jgi:hypothetical protein